LLGHHARGFFHDTKGKGFRDEIRIALEFLNAIR
jgi:hypothetical protein